MEDICTECKQLATFSCSCDNALRFCSDCYLFVHKNTQGNHDSINLDKISKEIAQKIHSKIQNLYKIKSQVIYKSNQLINIIQKISSKQLYFIQKNIDACEKNLNNRIEKINKEYENIEFPEGDLGLFEQMVTNIFSFFKDDNENIDSEVRKIESFNFSKNVKEIKKQLQTDFNLLLRGHTDSVLTVAVTSDSKYVISGSVDNTIRI